MKSRLFSTLNKRGKSDHLKTFDDLLKKKMTGLDYNNLTIENKYILHHTQSAFYFGTNDYANCYAHLSANTKLIEENPFLFQDEPNIYFSVLSNLIFVCNRLEKNAEASDVLKRLKNVQQVFDISNNEDLRLKHFNTLSSAEIALHKLTGNYTEALKSLPAIEESLQHFSGKLNPTRKGFYFFNLSAIYFANGKLSQALKWCNELLNDKTIDENENVRSYALVLSLLIHYELRHNDYFSMLAKQLQKQTQSLTAQSSHSAQSFFKAFIDFGQELENKNDYSSHKAALKKLQASLQKQKEEKEGAKTIEYFDFQRWVSSKISGLPFSLTENLL